MKNLKVKVKNGVWQINGIKVQDCPHHEKVLFDAFIRTSLINLPIPEAKQTQKQAVKEPFSEMYANVCDLVFDPA